MQLSNSPGKLVLPFASAGNKNSIPVDSQIGITPGAASLADGFPPLTMTPVAAGGVPPSGLDMNGILYELSNVIRWANAGGGYTYDADFATDSNVGGYPKGARVLRADGSGYWFNTADGNETDPDSPSGTGWVPDFTTGAATVAMASANVTLTPVQYGKPIIVITGALTSNLNLVFPDIDRQWTVVNATTGAFKINLKTASSVGVPVVSGFVGNVVCAANTIYMSGANFVRVTPEFYGAVGDGVTDDTQALIKWFACPSTDLFMQNKYRVVDSLLDGTPVLTSTIANRRIFGPGIITATTQVKKLLSVSGANNTISINIDGAANIGYAITVTGENPVITGCRITDLNGFANYGGVAINLDFGALDTSAIVSNNLVENLQGVGDGVAGNGTGQQRAVRIASTVACKKLIHIYGNIFNTVQGEEGDTITVSGNTGSAYVDRPTLIEGNMFYEWNRRAVKVQANKVTIAKNQFRNNLASDPGTLQRVVDIVQGGGHVISGNVFDECKYQTNIGVVLSAPEAADDFIVSGNQIHGIGAETASSPISLSTYGSDVVIADNVINCPDFTGTAITSANTINSLVCGNEINFSGSNWISYTGSTGLRLAANTVATGSTGNSIPRTSYYDITNDEHVFDVSSGNRRVTLYQGDDTVSDGEILAKLACRQNDSSAPRAINASVGFVGEGTSGALGVAIYTGSQASGTADTERVRVTAYGVLRPSTDNAQSLGAADNRWSEVYAGTGTINTSDERDKTDIALLSDVERKIALKIKSLIHSFRFKDSVNSKGDSARIHFGVIAQEVLAAFESEGLDASAYGILCYDEWEELAEFVDEDGKVVQPYRASGNRYGVRYDELLCFIIGAL